MQELGFRDQNQSLLHSVLFSSKPNFLLRAYSMDSPFIMPSKFASFYTSAPSSPSRSIFSHHSNPNICFYSVPSSPARRISKSSPNPSFDFTPDTSYGDKSPEFEFESSRRFDADVAKRCHRRHHESLPAMAFADDLFCEGKMMPLNPPPSQLYSSSSFNNFSSPGNGKFKIPFTKSLWNDDFDPFMVALETVREEKRGGNHRRAKSMLACTTFDVEEEMHENCLHSSPVIKLVKPNGPEVEDNGPVKSPIRLTEPKGVMFARRARMVKLGYNYERPSTSPGPIVLQVEVNERRRKNKWQKMLSFRKKRASDEKTEKDQSVEFARSKLRKLSFKSDKMVQQKKEVQVAKMTLVRYRPKLLLCMGYGAKIA